MSKAIKEAFESYGPKRFRSKPTIKRVIGPMPTSWSILTLEGTVVADIGDYIIEGLHGEYYPCKPDIFKKSYKEIKMSDSTRDDELENAAENKSELEVTCGFYGELVCTNPLESYRMTRSYEDMRREYDLLNLGKYTEEDVLFVLRSQGTQRAIALNRILLTVAFSTLVPIGSFLVWQFLRAK